MGFQDKLHHGECSEKRCAQDLSSGVQTLGDSFVGEAVGTGFQDKLPQCDCAEKLCAQDLSSGVQKHWAMGHA